MITISLDEQGVFENQNSRDQSVTMIAGIVYDDCGDVMDAEREKSRIKHYFQSICQKYHVQYPNALHFGHGMNNRVGDVKREYNATLGTFLKEGKYQGSVVESTDGKPRNGKYYVYALVKSRQGKRQLIRDDVSNLIHEQYASNLYMHMVEDTLSRLLFYNNQFIDQESVSFDLATRVYRGESNENISDHIAIGYSTRQVRDGQLVYLTSSDVFRTALERDMLWENENDIDVNSLMARSIRYDESGEGQEFLYLADAICSTLGFEVNYAGAASYINTIWNRMNTLAGDRRLLFCYDSVDDGFVRAWRFAENGDIYKSLSTLYDTLYMESDAASFYKQVWKKELIARLARKIDVSSMTMAIRKYEQSSRNNNINQQKMLFIFEELEKLVGAIDFRNAQDKSILHDLYDAGIAAYNHIGDTVKAKECAEKCAEYARYIGVERQIRNRNKRAVGLCDAFRYEEAKNLIKASYDYYKVVCDAQGRLLGEQTSYNEVEYAVVCSQMGQICSYLSEDSAEKYFEEALKHLEPQTADYYITESYFLHYYLAQKNREKYEQYAKEYFGGHIDLREQLEYLVQEGSVLKNPIISLKFGMFVYMKAIYTFYKDEVSEELLLLLLDLENTMTAIDASAKEQINGHPWEIIYKYLVLIAIYRKKPTIADQYHRKMMSCMEKKGKVVDIVNLFGEIEMDRLKTSGGTINGKLDKICHLIKEVNPDLKITNSFDAVEKIVSYTFR